MTKSANEKRWVMLPPPSANSFAVSDQIGLRSEASHRQTVRGSEDVDKDLSASGEENSFHISENLPFIAPDSTVRPAQSSARARGAQVAGAADPVRHKSGVCSANHERATTPDDDLTSERVTLCALPRGAEVGANRELDLFDDAFETIPAPAWLPEDD